MNQRVLTLLSGHIFNNARMGLFFLLVTPVLLHNYFLGSIGFATGCWSFNAWGAAGGQEHMLNSGA
jgi:hypothetical protein